MGNIFDPRCDVPIYLMPNVETAQKCGRYDAFMLMAIVLSLCLCVICCVFVLLQWVNGEPLIEQNPQDRIGNKRDYGKIGSVVCAMILVMMIVD